MKHYSNDDLSFQDWYDLFVDECRSLGYQGPIDQDSAHEDYDNDLEPEEAAKSLVDELNS